MKKLSILVSVILGACTSGHNEELHQQSIEMHEAALRIGKQANDKIKQFASEVEALADSSLLDSLASLKQGYQDWDESLVEVPGHEHDHHDHEGHDHGDHEGHDHSPAPDLTQEMVLEIQKELKLKAEKLNARADRLLELVKSQEEEVVEE